MAIIVFVLIASPCGLAGSPRCCAKRAARPVAAS
jgi:hypothetical protein